MIIYLVYLWLYLICFIKAHFLPWLTVCAPKFLTNMDHKHSSNCGCSEETKIENLATLYNLYSKIDTFNLECLNEREENSGKTVFRPWDKRLDREKVMPRRTIA